MKYILASPEQAKINISDVISAQSTYRSCLLILVIIEKIDKYIIKSDQTL